MMTMDINVLYISATKKKTRILTGFAIKKCQFFLHFTFDDVYIVH